VDHPVEPAVVAVDALDQPADRGGVESVHLVVLDR
jgi:hypothetical protein